MISPAAASRAGCSMPTAIRPWDRFRIGEGGGLASFRFIVSPEDAGEMTAVRLLPAICRARWKPISPHGSRGSRVDHWNIDSLHVHVLIRGATTTAPTLSPQGTASADACAHALRNSSQSSLVQNPSTRSVTRWSRRSPLIVGPGSIGKSGWLRMRLGVIDLRPDAGGILDLNFNRLMSGQLQYLERLGLTTSVWSRGVDSRA